MAIELVMLDFDGTLVDTAPDLIRATNRFLREQGFPEVPEKKLRDQIGFGLWVLVKEFLPDIAKDPIRVKSMEVRFLEIYEQEILHSPTFYPGALEFLRAWPGKIAIVSNKRSRFIHLLLQHLEIHTLPWSSVIGGDTFAQMKPHPMPFLEAMKKAGTDHAKTVMVGDGEPDIQGALAVGIRSVAVSFGYSPIEQLVHLGAHATIGDFSELSQILQKI